MKSCRPTAEKTIARPDWLKKKITSGSRYYELNKMINGLGLNTVCSEACCPNQAECYSNGTSTFMILGERCTRSCRFCAVQKSRPDPVNPGEPAAVASAIERMGLDYAVITSVTRDDLADGGAAHFSTVISAVRHRCPDIRIEVLVPDFQGAAASIATVIRACPDVLNHNVETVPTLYPKVRPEASYQQSIDFFRTAKVLEPELITKSGLMLGLGESDKEVEQTLIDLYDAGCDILTLGQYLAPSADHHPVVSYLKPEDFISWERKAQEIGFAAVVAGSFVRSSYNAFEIYRQAKQHRKQSN